jgi:uncharacterized membrane protein
MILIAILAIVAAAVFVDRIVGARQKAEAKEAERLKAMAMAKEREVAEGERLSRQTHERRPNRPFRSVTELSEDEIYRIIGGK